MIDEFKNYTTDPFWLGILESVQRGETQKNFRIWSEDSIVFIETSEGKKAVSSKPEEAFLEIVEQLRNIGIRSPRDTEKIDIEWISKQYRDAICCEWKQLRPKQLKEYFLFNFVQQLQIKYKLSQHEVKSLISFISLGFYLRFIRPEDIIYRTGKIESVKGLRFNTRRRRFKFENVKNPTMPKQNKRSSGSDVLTLFVNKFVRETKT